MIFGAEEQVHEESEELVPGQVQAAVGSDLPESMREPNTASAGPRL